MQADKDDMPEYLRSRKQEGPWRMAAIMGVGAAIVLGGISLFGKDFIDDANAIKDGRKRLDGIAIQRSSQQSNTQRAEVARREANYQPKAWKGGEDVIITNKSAAFEDAPAQQEKQTTFNDRNYSPNGAINVVSFNTTGWQDEEQNVPVRKQKDIVVVGKQDRQENWVCSFFGKEGSIEKRDCKSGYQLRNRNTGR